jgi:DNA repair protein RecN (Recombination protein N)
MLSLLTVRNLAIVDSLRWEPGPGLNIITGETGAGKSILVAALKLVLGGKGRGDMVRTGADRADVEALFELGDDPALRTRFAEAGLGPCEQLVVRRELLPSGRTRSFLNGRLVPGEQLVALASGLVDISSQHQHHSLVDPASHLHWLDAFAGLHTDDMARAFAAVQAARAARATAEAALHGREEREALLRWQLQEVERLQPQPGELPALEARLARGRHAERLLRAAQSAADTLYSGEAPLGPRLARVIADLTDAGRIEPRLAELAARVDAARVELIEAGRDCAAWADAQDLDAEALATAEERLHALKRLARRHGGDLDAVRAWGSAAAAELAALAEAEAAVEAAERAATAREAEARAVAAALSAARKAAADALGHAISTELASLGMGGARVHIAVAAHEGPRALGPTGQDRVEFLIAPNPGEEPRPLGRVASGGELSRALLATKRVLAGIGPVGTYVFDEVDTGVGGAVAEAIGRKLHAVGAHHQVLCITHQPQVAAYATRHFRVQKEVSGGRTCSAIVALDGAARQEELARMLGGIDVTEGARQAAQALLHAAHAARAA